jgi:hypothetical protein
MSNIFKFFKNTIQQNVFAKKSSETDVLKSQHVGKRTTIMKSHYVMLDLFLNATEGSNNRSHTTPPVHNNLAASILSIVIRKDTTLKQYSATQLKTHKVRDAT